MMDCILLGGSIRIASRCGYWFILGPTSVRILVWCVLLNFSWQVEGLETYSEIFCVQDDLLPLSLGKKDSNLVEARKLSGVTAVEFDKKYNVFSVSGVDRKAVQKARNMLDYIQEDVCIPRTLVGKYVIRVRHSRTRTWLLRQHRKSNRFWIHPVSLIYFRSVLLRIFIAKQPIFSWVTFTNVINESSITFFRECRW